MLYLTGESMKNENINIIFSFFEKLIATIDDEKIMRLLWVDDKYFVICIDSESFKVLASHLMLWGSKNEYEHSEYNNCKISVVNEYNELESPDYSHIIKNDDHIYTFSNNGIYDLYRCAKFLNPVLIVRVSVAMKNVATKTKLE